MSGYPAAGCPANLVSGATLAYCRDMSGVTGAGSEPLLSGGLAMALAYINRVKADLGPAQKLHPRSDLVLFLVFRCFRDSLSWVFN